MNRTEKPQRRVSNVTWGYIFAVAAGIVMVLPSLGLGFIMDDYAQLALVEGWYPEDAGTFNLYSFLGELTFTPWWKHPEFKVTMWRPLSSALIHLDNYLFGHDAVAYHVHSILWLAALLAVCGRLYAKLLPPGTGILALLIFGLDECHFLTAGWIANRHSMVAMVPALLGVYAHLRWREEGWRPGLPLSILGYGVGFLGGEVTLSVMAYAVAYELFVPQAGWPRRLTGLAPLAAVGVPYFVVYKAMGFGAARSGFYLDPVGEPVAFVLGVAGHVPALLAAALAGLVSDLWFFVPALRPAQVVIGIAASLVVALLLRSAWPDLDETVRRHLRWLVPGALLSLLPVAIAQPFDRVLIVPMIGLAVLLASLLVSYRRRWRGIAGGAHPGLSRKAAAVVTVGLAVLHFIVPTISRTAGSYVTSRQWQILGRMAAEIPIEPATAADTDVIVFNAPDAIIGSFLPLVRRFAGQPPLASWSLLAMTPHDLVATRTDSRTLELQVIDGQLLTSQAEQFHRPDSYKLQPGDVIESAVFEVEILDANALGPTRVGFRFNRALNASSLAFLAWREHGLERVELPEIGSSLRLDQAPGAVPMALKGLAPFWSW